MTDEVQRLFEMMDQVREKATSRAVFGDPIVIEERTVIPVAQVTYGFGLGFDSSAGEGAEGEPAEEDVGGGGGGGAGARPIGVVEVTREGVQVKPIVDEQKLAIGGALLVAWITVWVARTLVRIFGKD
ncbi:MAG: spore germination protein GerW family protein [Anaerolineae bacterium]|jgi:uncharacterized spore protein YtfJ